MASFGPGTNIIGGDAISKALERRRGGQPVPVGNQMSQSAPGPQPPQNPEVPQSSARVMPGQPQSSARVAPDQAQSAQPATAANPEVELILKAMNDRLKTINKAEAPVQQPAQQAAQGAAQGAMAAPLARAVTGEQGVLTDGDIQQVQQQLPTMSDEQKKALVAPLARAMSGQQGVLTDRDVQRAEIFLGVSQQPDVIQILRDRLGI